MAGDWLQHFSTGSRVKLSARRENLLNEVARNFQRTRRPIGAGDVDTFAPEQAVYVKNNSGSDCEEFDVLGIDSMVISPTDNEAHFKWRRPVINGVKPTTASHTGKFVLTFEPIKSGEIGRAYIAGYCPAYVNMQSATDPYADVTDGNTDHLTSGASGAAQILWAPSGKTGNQWVLVRLGQGAPGLIPVNLTQSGGSDGTDADGAASYTYNATNAFTGASISGGPFTVKWARADGHVNKATHGFGFYDQTGTFQLWITDETPVDDNCSSS